MKDICFTEFCRFLSYIKTQPCTPMSTAYRTSLPSPLRVDCIHRVELGEVSGHRVLIKRGPGNRVLPNVEAPTRPRLECRRETSLIPRCDRKVGNLFQRKQGSRPSCRDQEGRRGSEEVVPENLGVPLQGDRDAGELCRGASRVPRTVSTSNS